MKVSASGTAEMRGGIVKTEVRDSGANIEHEDATRPVWLDGVIMYEVRCNFGISI